MHEKMIFLIKNDSCFIILLNIGNYVELKLLKHLKSVIFLNVERPWLIIHFKSHTFQREIPVLDIIKPIYVSDFKIILRKLLEKIKVTITSWFLSLCLSIVKLLALFFTKTHQIFYNIFLGVIHILDPSNLAASFRQWINTILGHFFVILLLELIYSVSCVSLFFG